MKKVLFSFVRQVHIAMETKSPYFSPKKTRNFTKQNGLTLLQKVTQATQSNKPKEPVTKSTRAEKKVPASSKLPEDVTVNQVTNKVRKRNIRSDAAPKVTPRKEAEIVYPPPPNERTPVKEETGQGTSEAGVIKSEIKQKLFSAAECATDFLTTKIKIEPADEVQALNEKTPCKQEVGDDVRSPVKRELETESLANEGKELKWEPKNWRQMMDNIREMRRANLAPVDTMGCDQFAQDVEKTIPDAVKRYHCLVSLMLSSQTKDQVNHECMQRLKKHGLTPESIVATEAAVLEKLIYPVSFYKNKTKFIKQVSQILIDQYDGDIPNTIEGLLKLPGVGKKMAHLCMGAAWNIVTGIGVDTHVHRISNWLQWVPKETKTPEDTRQALEKWLPFEMWEEVNHMLVGFGQTICTSTYPRCNDCLNAPICPARGKHGIRKTPIKKEVKTENLEF